QDVVQLSAAPPEPAPGHADFTEIVRGSIAATRGMFESQAIDLSALLPLERLPITGHPGQIGRALAVLLKAAARRVMRGSRARLTLSREGSPESPVAALSVRDNAPAGAPLANAEAHAEVSAPR